MDSLKFMKICVSFLALACVSACGIIPIDVPVRVYNVKNGYCMELLNGLVRKGLDF
jgi:hypothetical protein